MVETGAAEHQAEPQKSTNWVLMRSTASVSEELLRFFYFQTAELLFFPSHPADTHISWSYRGGRAGLALLAFLPIITQDWEEQELGLGEMGNGE